MAKAKSPRTTALSSSTPSLAERLQALFPSNTRSSGRYEPTKDRGWQPDEPLLLADFQGHVAGVMGIGGVPILDDDSCWWAAIDLDDHESDEDMPIDQVEANIRTHKMPLIACRSKSGGIHCYMFLAAPQPATRVRAVMMRWAGLLGYGGAEVFPKQGKLTVGREGTKNKGNWINFPYFGGDETMRYAKRDGRKLDTLEFCVLAEKMRQTEHDLRALSLSDHPEAPPCIQSFYQHGVAQGQRNETLYNITVYLRKKDPVTVEAAAMEANNSVFGKPLPRAEMLRTINSAARKSMQYRCNEEPLKSNCNREECLRRKHGITPEDAERLDTIDALPTFTDMVKYMTEPIRWEFKMNGVQVGNIDTRTLLDWRSLREVIMDRLTMVVPLVNNKDWERTLAPLVKDARIVDTPDDASVAGVIRDRLREFASKTDLINRGEDKSDRKAILRGLPVVQVLNGDRCIIFRGQDFVNYLKRTKSEELKGVNLWFAVKAIGVFTQRIRIPGAKSGEDNINVWALPIKEVLGNLTQEAEAPEFRSEL